MSSKLENEDCEHYWSFGFGSNMDVEFVEKTKEVQVLGRIS